MNTAEQFREIVRAADLLAAALAKRLKPSSDHISKRQACEEYGRALIESNTAPKGVLQPIRMGKAKNSPLYYSRLEIAALIEVQRQQRREVALITSNK